MTTLYIGKSGRLSRKDNTLRVTYKDGKYKDYGVENIDIIYAFGELDFNTKLIDFLAKMEITIHFFNYYGYYSGSFYPKEHYFSGKVHIEQVKAVESKKGLEIAKGIVLAIGENTNYLLNNYYKHSKDVKVQIDKITENIKKIEVIETKEQLLQVEGAIWNNFYQSFDKILNDDFKFESRSKRPPQNPLNAMISFTKSLVYTLTLSKIYETQLTPDISYLHSPSERRFSLSLDLSESFHLILAFRLIFKLINRKMIQVNKHFRDDLNGVLLNDEGKRVVVTEWDKMINETIEHKTLKRAVKYKNLPKHDGDKLVRYLMDDREEFKPFILKDKC